MKQITKVLTIVALTAYTVGIAKSEVAKAADFTKLENSSYQTQPPVQEPQLLAQAIVTYQGLGEITVEENGENRTAKISRVTIDTRQGRTAAFNITTDDGRRYSLIGRITENTETGGYKVSLTTLRAGQSQEIPAQGVLAVTRTGEISPEGDLTYTGTRKLLAISFTPTADTGTTEPVRGLW
jgi:hypothetical protein